MESLPTDFLLKRTRPCVVGSAVCHVETALAAKGARLLGGLAPWSRLAIYGHSHPIGILVKAQKKVVGMAL
jgi:hypothetical protein